jgi:acyl transferase domain-containing protein
MGEVGPLLLIMTRLVNSDRRESNWYKMGIRKYRLHTVFAVWWNARDRLMRASHEDSSRQNLAQVESSRLHEYQEWMRGVSLTDSM